MSDSGHIKKEAVLEAVHQFLRRFESSGVSLEELTSRWQDVIPQLHLAAQIGDHESGDGYGDYDSQLSDAGALVLDDDDDEEEDTPTVITQIGKGLGPDNEVLSLTGGALVPEGELDAAIDDLLEKTGAVVISEDILGEPGDSAVSRVVPQGRPPKVHIQNQNLAPGDDGVQRSGGEVREDQRKVTDLRLFEVGDEIARGGQGRILSAHDNVIGRPLALKILHPEASSNADLVSRFWEEAQITGQLEHPHIVPVHAMGWREDKTPFYMMKRIEGQTLRKIIVAIRKGRENVIRQFSQARLLLILQKVCQAIAYAHARGVIHRDLKPANVMVGGYGEVLVLDWGVAKVLGNQDRVRDVLRPVVTERRRSGTSTMVGTVEGTPSYMSPEQARGDVDAIDARSDVYALGAILYEILTYRPPFRGKDWRKVLEQVVRDPPIPPRVRAPERNISPELEAICLRCLSKDPKSRYPSAEALDLELEAFLEGTKRRHLARRKVQSAKELMTEYRQLRQDVLVAGMVARRAAQGLEGWEPVESKRGIWVTEDRVKEKGSRLAVAFGECAARFGQALGFDPDNGQAREGLADLYKEGLVDAEKRGDVTQQVYYEEMIRQYHDGKYALFLQGNGQVTIHSHPAGAEVWIAGIEEKDRVLRPTKPRSLGRTPLVNATLPRGSYLVVMKRPGFLDVRFPLFLGRLESLSFDLNLYRGDQVGEGFIVVPRGPYRRGGDSEAIDPLSTDQINVPSFAITRFPVTFRQYLGFLDALAMRDPEEAESRVPWLDDRGALAEIGPGGRYTPIPDLMSPEVRQQLYGEGAEWDLPIFGVEFEDGEAFCEWAAEQTGRPVRLPREDEWEKAARGMDRRPFPWGHWFDPTFCKSRLSRPYTPEPEPVGAFAADTSPYGVQDLAGSVREWCDGWYSELEGLRVLRGGSWVDTDRRHRSASRGFYDPQAHRRLHGFRCAFDLPDPK